MSSILDLLESASLEELLAVERKLPVLIKRGKESMFDRTIEQAILCLAGRCDGAVSPDKIGFNGADATYGGWLARQIEQGLTWHQAQIALKILQKYKNTQLSHLVLPEWDNIKHQYPKVLAHVSSEKAIELPSERLEIIGDEVAVFAPFDPTREFQKKAKSIQNYRFEGNDKSWRYPIAQLLEILEIFPYEKFPPEDFEGAIALQQMIEAEKITEQEEEAQRSAKYIVDLIELAKLDEPLANGWNLFAHQKEASQWLLSRTVHGIMKGGILADDMGLGKTICSLVAAKALVKKHNIPVFLICPASLKDNWLIEAEKVGVAIEVFSWAKIPEPLDEKQYVLIADEAHMAQNNRSKRGEALLKLAQNQNCIAAWMLTGTPLKNGRPLNLMPLLMAVEHPLVEDHWEYQKRYCAAHKGRFGWDNTGAAHLDELRAKTTDVILRRKKKDCVDLPEKIRTMKPIEIDSKTLKEYQGKIDALVKDYRLRAEKGEVSRDAEALATLNILRKTGSEYKIDSTIELAQDILEQDEQVVIFTEFLEPAKQIHSVLGGELLTGETPTKERQSIVDRFQSGQSKVFVGTIKAGGVGITLTKASNVILHDRPWTPGDADQSEDRCYRIGQKNTVTAFWVQLGDVDQAIDFLIQKKQERIDLVLKGKRKTLRGVNSVNDLAKELLANL